MNQSETEKNDFLSNNQKELKIRQPICKIYPQLSKKASPSSFIVYKSKIKNYVQVDGL